MDKFKGTSRYILSYALREIVNAAIVLQRPLLLKGEPGTGKTELAQVIAEDLNLRLIRWNIKSPRIQSIGRGFAVLFAIAHSDSGLHTKDIIEELGLDRQTVYHILQSLSAIGVITKTGSGTLTLDTSNTNYTGTINLNGGTTVFSTINNLGAASTAINFDGGTLQYASGNTADISSRFVTLNAGGGTIDVGANYVAFASPIGGGGPGGSGGA